MRVSGPIDDSLASFWCETSPAGATQESPGCKPWEQAQQQRKPRRGDAVGLRTKEVLVTSIYLELRPNSLRRPFRASAIWTLNPGLAPWAVLLDPFGVPGFAPETS